MGMGDAGVGFWRRWIELQATHNLQKMAELSIKNFHFPGLNYVCFEFTPAHTARLYIVDPRERLETRSVQIHNHLYDSQILCLKGSILNTVYKIDNQPEDASEDYHLYRLTSALHPENKERQIKLEFMMKRALRVEKEIRLSPGESHFQKHTEIHSVENNPDELTAFMVFEFPTVKERSTLFSKKELGETIPTPGCYLKYEPEELKALVMGLLDQMK